MKFQKLVKYSKLIMFSKVISLAKNVLDWQPRVLLKQGLEKTIDYFRKELSRKHYSDGIGVHPDEYQIIDNEIK